MAAVRWIACRCAASIAIGLAAAGGTATTVAAQQRVGVSGGVNQDATATPPGAPSRRLVIGQDIVYNERITTSPVGQTQVLFVDESALSVGPSSDVTIDKFVYNPSTGTGQLAMSATRGVMRFVGGKISKQDNAVTLNTRAATIGIRGGVFLLDQSAAGKMNVIFLYGRGLTVAGGRGCAQQQVTRPGFEVSVGGAGACPSAPFPAPPGATQMLIGQLDGKTGANGGASQVPTEATVVSSGIANTISNNVATSVQQAAQNQPARSLPPTISVATLQNRLQVNTVQNQGQSEIASAIANPPAQGSPIGTTPPPVTPIPPVVITYAGRFKDTNGNGTALGFIDQSSQANIPYTNGTLTFPPGNPNAGVFRVVTGNDMAQFPLVPGNASFGSANTSSNFGPLTGTTYLAPDNTFFYANVTPVNFPNERGFFFGGQPVNASFFAGNLPAQITAFQIQPDAVLASGSQAQTIPFLPSQYGGTFPNASVSNIYLATGANSPFGSNASPNFVSPKFLQASLAINGQGANQTSALVIATGNFFTSADTGLVAAAGPVRGAVMLNAGSPEVRIGSGLASVSDGNNNALFGGNTLTGFVLDQNQYSFNGNFVPALATASQFGQTAVNYAFNQPVTATSLPASASTARQALNETGFFGGLMSHTATPTTGSPYVLSGAVSSLQSALNNNRLAATFAGSDPFTATQSGITSVVLSFGDITGDTNASRGTYINNNIYAATDSPITASTINGNALPLPPNSTTAAPSPGIGLVTSGTVPDTSWMPAGVVPCSCQYLQWGYWTAQLVSTPTTGLGVNRTDRGDINTWVAGMPTPAGDLNTLAMQGAQGTFTGAAVGSVFNAGNTYLAAGNFTDTYNFGRQSGTIAISNFDGRNFSGAIAGSAGTYAGTLTGTNVSGLAQGSFFGPMAAETGGNFSIQSTAGARYLASGIFAGAR